MTKNKIFLLFFLFVMLALIAGIGYFIFYKTKSAENFLNEFNARYSRIDGIKNSSEDLKKLHADAKIIFEKKSYDSKKESSQVGNEAQQKIRSLVSDSALDLSSIQLLPSKQDKDFEIIPINIRSEGFLVNFENFFAALENQYPSIYTESLNMQTAGFARSDQPQRLIVQLNLYVLRKKK
jgi:general secretion pathway protein M